MADYKLINGRISSPQRATSAKGRGRGLSRGSSGHKSSSGSTQGGPGIPIHVDGSRDELSNVDPDLTLAELELRLLREGHAGSSRPGSCSRRSVGIASSSSTMSQNDGSRARPIKPHENEPFLAIGSFVKASNSEATLPETPKKERLMPQRNAKPDHKARSSSPSHSHSAGRSSRVSTPQGIRGHSCNPSPSMSMGYLSDRSQGQRILSRMFASSNASTLRANPHIKMPFKHNIRKPSEKVSQEPAQEMMELTALATYQVNRILASENGTVPKKKHGRIKKGKLQPLYPVNNTGPTMAQCRGILAETRSYSASASRTLQRRKHIVSQLKSGKLGLHGDASLTKDGRESVHIVSAASSVEDVAEAVAVEEEYPDFQAELASMEHDAMFSQELEQKMSFNKEMSSMSQGRYSTGPAKTPISLDQDIADLQSPDFSTPHPPANSTTTSSTPGAEERMEVSEVKGQSQTDNVTEDSNTLGKEDIREKEVESIGGIGPGVNNANNNFRIERPAKSLPDLRRPQSASVQYSQPATLKSEAKARPKTAASVKAVRFAERAHSSDGSTVPVLSQDSLLERGRGRNGQGRKSSGGGGMENSGKVDKGKSGKSSGGSSCKPTDSGSNKRDVDDDDDDDVKGGGRGGGGGGGVRKQTGSSSSMSTGRGGSTSTIKDSQPTTSQQGETKDAAGDKSSNAAQGEVTTQTAYSSGTALTASHQAVNAATGSETNPAVERSVCENHIRQKDTYPREILVAERNLNGDCIVHDGRFQHSQSTGVISQLSSDSSTSTAESRTASTPCALSWSTIIGEREGYGRESMTPVLPPPPATLSVKLDAAAEGQVPEGSSLLQLLLDVSSDAGDQLLPSEENLSPTPSDCSVSPLSPSHHGPCDSGPISHASDIYPASPHVSSHLHDAGSVSAGFLGVAVDAVVSECSSKGDQSILRMDSELNHSHESVQSSKKRADQGHCVAMSNNPSGDSAAEQLPAVTATTITTSTITSSTTTITSTSTTNPKKAAAPSSVTTIMHSANSVNPRVTVLVCKHDYSSDKKHTKAAELGIGGVPCPQTSEDEAEEEEDDCCSNLGNKYHGKNIHGNRLSELFTHLSLGVNSSHKSSHSTHSFHRPGASASILKQKSCSTHCLRKKSMKAQHNWELGECHSANISDRIWQHAAKLGKGVSRQQIFTHHSKEPFVYTTSDPVSKAVALRLKYGDSPYLKEVKVPSRMGDRVRKTKDKDKLMVSDKDDEEKMSSRERFGSLHSDQYHQPTRVKFASLSTPLLDLNQNCDYESEYYSAVFGLDEDDEDDSHLHHSNKHISYALATSDDGYSQSGDIDDDDNDNDGYYHSDCDNTGDFASRFDALESELKAVRSEIKLTMLDRQAEQLLEEDYDQENYSIVTGADPCIDAGNNNEDSEDSDYVYEDDGTSDEDEMDPPAASPGSDEGAGRCGDGDKGGSERQSARDEDQAYSTYFRALLREYRDKCRTVGKGSLVMSEKITWPYSQFRPASSMDPGNPPQHAQTFRTRPHSAGCFRTLSERRSSSGRMDRRRNSFTDQSPSASRSLSCAASLSDSGWESEGLSAFGGKLLDHWSSCLSTDGESVLTSRCNSSMEHGAWEKPASQDPIQSATAEREVRKDAPSKVASSRPSSGREDQPNLTVVASSAPKIPARPKMLHHGELGPPAPFPPLCFAVNARPPSGSLFFFAYCTFMNPDRLGSLLSRQMDKRYWAVLFGFDLSFNKKGLEEGSGGLANIVFNPFSSVEGCVFLLTPPELDKLDALTSAPQQYTRVVLPVWMSEVSGPADDLGLAKYCVPAVTYIAQDEWTLKEGCSPNEFVASQCLKSADLLTANYCDRLQSMVSSAPKLPASQSVIS